MAQCLVKSAERRQNDVSHIWDERPIIREQQIVKQNLISGLQNGAYPCLEH